MLRELLIGVIGIAAASRIQDQHILDLNQDRANPSYVPPTTTIVVPTYNDAPMLAIALKSIYDQTMLKAYPDRFDILIIDAGSDETPEIVKSYGATYARAGRGKLHARDLGFNISQSSLVVSIDSDLFLPPSLLALLLAPFSDPSVVASGGSYVTVTGNPYLDLLTPTVDMGLRFLLRLRGALIGGVNAIKRDAYFQVGGFDLSQDTLDYRKVIYAEEDDLAHRLSLIGRVIQTDALAFHSDRRLTCTLNPFRKNNPQDPLYQYCREMGVSRF